ncbi:MAG: hypothetical protein ACRDXX_08730 [Stackebrandtia sp.]
MTISGEKLGAELRRLRWAGRNALPEAAAIYAQANRHVHNTSWREKEGFDEGRTIEFGRTDWRSPSPSNLLGVGAISASVEDGEVLGATYANWKALRDELQRFMADTALALVVAGAGLEGIALGYAETDEEAAAALARGSESLDDIPEVPQVRYPGDPHDADPPIRTRGVDLAPRVGGFPGSGPIGIPGGEVPAESPRPEPVDPLAED